jgi:hypothetical protein
MTECQGWSLVFAGMVGWLVGWAKSLWFWVVFGCGVVAVLIHEDA